MEADMPAWLSLLIVAITVIGVVCGITFYAVQLVRVRRMLARLSSAVEKVGKDA